MIHKDLSHKLVCVIDLGSNSIRTNVYLLGDNFYNLVWKDKYAARFSKGLTKNKKLSGDTIDKALDYLKELKKKLKGFRLYTTIAVATSALRLAKNASDFVDPAEEILGTHIDIISHEQEATLAVEGVELEVGKFSGVVFDLGGGSLEIASVKNSKVQSIDSLVLGHQVLSDVAEDGIDKLRDYIEKEFAKVDYLNNFKIDKAFLTGGQFRRLAKLHMKLTRGEITDISDYRISRKKLKELIIVKERNLKTKPEALLMYYSALLLDHIMNKAKVNTFVFCGNSIREGLLVEWL